MENIIEYLIPLIFILAYVVPKAMKKNKQQEEPDPAEVKETNPGLFDKLNKMVEEYHEREQDAAKRREEKEEEYDWYQDRDEYESDEDEDVSESEPEPAKPAAEVVNAEEVTTYPRAVSTPVSPPGITTLQPKPADAESSLYVSANVTKQELRKAIIWSEVLAPPKALRDE